MPVGTGCVAEDHVGDRSREALLALIRGGAVEHRLAEELAGVGDPTRRRRLSGGGAMARIRGRRGRRDEGERGTRRRRTVAGWTRARAACVPRSDSSTTTSATLAAFFFAIELLAISVQFGAFLWHITAPMKMIPHG